VSAKYFLSVNKGESMKLCGYKRHVKENRLARTPTNFKWSQNLEPNLSGCGFAKKRGRKTRQSRAIIY